MTKAESEKSASEKMCFLPAELRLGGDTFVYRIIKVDEAEVILCERVGGNSGGEEDYTPKLVVREKDGTVFILPDLQRSEPYFGFGEGGKVLSVKRGFLGRLGLRAEGLMTKKFDFLRKDGDPQGFRDIEYFDVDRDGCFDFFDLDMPEDTGFECDLEGGAGIRIKTESGEERVLPSQTPVIIPCPKTQDNKDDALVVQTWALVNDSCRLAIDKRYRMFKENAARPLRVWG